MSVYSIVNLMIEMFNNFKIEDWIKFSTGKNCEIIKQYIKYIKFLQQELVRFGNKISKEHDLFGDDFEDIIELRSAQLDYSYRLLLAFVKDIQETPEEDIDFADDIIQEIIEKQIFEKSESDEIIADYFDGETC